MGTSFYPSKDETYHAIALGNFLHPFDFKTKREDNAKLNVKYRHYLYVFWSLPCIVDHLVANYGKDKFLLYTKV